MSWLDKVRHFSADEFNDPDGVVMDEQLVVMLDEARDDAGVPCWITSSWRSPGGNATAGGQKDSAHLIADDGRARAIDGFLEGWSLLAQFTQLTRYPFFGIGLYPFPLPSRDPRKPWTPVFHVDRKDRGKRFSAKALWIRNRAGVYVYWPSPEFKFELRAIARMEVA